MSSSDSSAKRIAEHLDRSQPTKRQGSSSDSGSSNPSPAKKARNEPTKGKGQSSSSQSSSEEEEEEKWEKLVIFSPREMLNEGLLLLGWTQKKIDRVEESTNSIRFRSHFNCNPPVAAQIWEDLQTTKIEGANINEHSTKRKPKSLRDFLAAMHFLARHGTENEREPLWKKSKNTLRRDTWVYIDCIRALKAEKIVWPKDFGDLIWVLTVDGTHLRSHEPGDTDIPKDPAYFSYKHHCAGFNYELALSLTESRLIWMSGPHAAGTYNDTKIFKEKGLAHKLKKAGKKGIADGGYNGYSSLLSLPNNSHDDPEVRKFKSRAWLCHESFNRMLKTFKCLSETFRHSRECLQACFEACAVVTQYKMERGYPLYSI